MRSFIRTYIRSQREQRQQSGEKGFSLIELIVVVVILGILAAIAIPTFVNIQNTAKQNAADTVAANAATTIAAAIAADGNAGAADLESLETNGTTIVVETNTGENNALVETSNLAGITDFTTVCVTATVDGTSGTSGPACD